MHAKVKRHTLASQSLTSELCTLTNQQPSTPPLSPASIRSKLLYCWHLSCQPARQHFPPELYLIWGYVSKALTSENPVVWTCSDPVGKGLPKQWLVLTGPLERLCCHAVAELCVVARCLPTQGKFVGSRGGRGLELMAQYNTKPAPVLMPLAFLFQYQQTWLLPGSLGTFPCGETIRPLPNSS